jgi:hypothetical protein
MADPTAETERLAEQHLRPRKQRVLKAIAALLKEDPGSSVVKGCFMNILAPTVMLDVHGHARRKLFGRDVPTASQLSATADQFVAFALGGVDALAKGHK